MVLVNGTRLDHATLIRFSLDNLGTQNAHHEFEHICRDVARARLCPNLLPSTGPVSAGGDGGIDFESFASCSNQGGVAVLGTALAGEPIVFCCSLRKDVGPKVKEDIERVKQSRPDSKTVFFFSNQPIAVGLRNQLCVDARAQHGIVLTVVDRDALTELLVQPDLFWIARERLRIPAGDETTDSLVFESVELVTSECAWHPMSRTLGQAHYPFASHQLRMDMWPEERRAAERRTLDPIFDLTLINRSARPLLLSGVGFEPVRAWAKLKGLPVAAKVFVSDAYELGVHGFECGTTQLFTLPDPVYLQAEAPYRYKLRLLDYGSAVPGNESAIRLVARAADQEFHSAQIYLGLV